MYNDSVIVDRYGILPIQAYGDLRNDDWRFAAGLQFDIFNPLNPTVPPFSRLAASGNAGAYRGQARVERFLHPSDDTQITLTTGVSEPIPTILTPNLELTEDNGWPNVEGRVAVALGPLVGEGPLATRPFEWGFSGVRNDTYFANLIWDATKHFRIAGEVTYRKTAYTVVPNNDGIGFHMQVQWRL